MSRSLARVLGVLALALCLGGAQCEQDDTAVRVANAAADTASTSPIPWVALVGSLGSGVLAALGLRSAGKARSYTDVAWSANDLAELLDGLSQRPEALARLRAMLAAPAGPPA